MLRLVHMRRDSKNRISSRYASSKRTTGIATLRSANNPDPLVRTNKKG